MVSLQFLSCPTSTAPGAMLMNKTPSPAYSALNLATAVFIAALLIEYGPATSIEYSVVRSLSANPDERVMTFLTPPFRMSGM